MSFKGLAFIRQWAKEHIYKPRVLGEQLGSASDLAEAFRKDARSAQVKIEEVEEEVGPLGTGYREVDGRPTDRHSEIMGTSIGAAGYQWPPTR
jgi:hypothetical protein